MLMLMEDLACLPASVCTCMASEAGSAVATYMRVIGVIQLVHVRNWGRLQNGAAVGWEGLGMGRIWDGKDLGWENGGMGMCKAA